MINPFESIEKKLDLILEKISKLEFREPDKMKGWGDISLAEEVTGYKTATIYIKVSRGEIPYIKRDGKLWFNRDELIDWIAKGSKTLSSK